jgi:hypothetical protein
VSGIGVFGVVGKVLGSNITVAMEECCWGKWLGSTMVTGKDNLEWVAMGQGFAIEVVVEVGARRVVRMTRKC